MVFVLYLIRILPQKGFQNSRKQSNFNLNARNFVCGWGTAPGGWGTAPDECDLGSITYSKVTFGRNIEKTLE